MGEIDDDGTGRIGRFQLLRKIGQGGMGLVYSAYDEELDRRVAIKLIRHQSDAGHAARMRREAQAMAKLTHPNVVPVYDVGLHEGQLFIAMEFVKGHTLRQWVQEAAREPSAVVEVYGQAARGLAAAHRAGLVHRDFKPDNAVVGVDGRVRVLDFGLARRDAPGDGPSGDDVLQTELPRPKTAELDTPLTEHGAIMGTPAYMAPEQFLGEASDARTDQFAFCVALYEALYGSRPFAGKDRVTLAANVTRGAVAPAPAGSKVPASVRQVVVQGLATEPDRRHASMDALCAALEGAGRRTSRRRWGVAGVAIAVSTAGAWGVGQLAEQRAVAACEREGAEIDTVWNDEARAAIRASFSASGAGNAATTIERVMPWLDAHAEAWRQARTDACVDAEVSRRWDSDLLDRSSWCLDERRLQLQSLVAQLSDADTESVMRAVPAAASLKGVEPCRDAATLARMPAPPREGRAEVQAVRAELARVAALEATGAYEAGLAQLRELQARVEASDWPPLRAAARVREGSLLELTAALTEAESVLESAYFEAAEADAAEEALDAADNLAYVVGDGLARHADARRWVRLGDLLRDELPDQAGLREADGLAVRARMEVLDGAYENAVALYERALAIEEEAVGPDHPRVAAALSALANAHTSTGDYEPAVALHTRALAVREHALGPDHPAVAANLSNLANARSAMGMYAEAAALQERAIAIAEQALGAEHPGVARDIMNLANTRFYMGDYTTAESLQQRAIGILEAALGPRHRDVAEAVASMGALYMTMGDSDRAEPLLERALSIFEETLGPDHPTVGRLLNNLGGMRGFTGRFEEGEALLRRALDIRERSLGPDHVELAQTLSNLGALLHTRGAYDEALRVLERALAIRERALGSEHPDVATNLAGLSAVYLATGRTDEAEEVLVRALRIHETTLGTEHPDVVFPLNGLAEVAMHRGEDAVAFAERALRVREAAGLAAPEIADTKRLVVRTLLARPGADDADRARALQLAIEALETYRAGGDALRDSVAAAEELMARAGRAPPPR